MECNFKKVMRGYDVDEVNNYIERMTLEFDAKISEKKSELQMLKSQNVKMNDEIKEVGKKIQLEDQKKSIEFQKKVNEIKNQLKEKDEILEKLARDNKGLKEKIEAQLGEKDFEISRLLQIKETQIKELESELEKIKESNATEKRELEKFKSILSEREAELEHRINQSQQRENGDIDLLKEKIIMQEKEIKELTLELENSDQLDVASLEQEKKRIANAILQANEQADRIIFQAQIEAEKIEKEMSEKISFEEKRIEKMRDDIEYIKSVSGKILSNYDESLEEVINEIEKARDLKNPANWSIVNG